MLAIAAPADWLYALITANWSLQMGYEISLERHVARVVARSKALLMTYCYSHPGSDDVGAAEYEALGTEAGVRGTLLDAEHPEIDLEDTPAVVVKEMVWEEEYRYVESY